MKIFLDGEKLLDYAQNGEGVKLKKFLKLADSEFLDINYQNLETGETALMSAANTDIAFQLIKNGAGKIPKILRKK